MTATEFPTPGTADLSGQGRPALACTVASGHGGLGGEVQMPVANSAVAVHFERPVDYHDELKATRTAVRFLLVPRRRYLMVEGTARPGEQEFRDAISTLYPVAYTLHFTLKRRGVEAPVGALEGAYSSADQRRWTWRLLLRVPDAATDGEVSAAIEEVRTRKRPPLIARLRCETWEEGTAAQILHMGPYDAETETIDRLHAAIESRGLRPDGWHHEIYISDPNRTSPEKLKTVIRQPVGQAGPKEAKPASPLGADIPHAVAHTEVGD